MASAYESSANMGGPAASEADLRAIARSLWAKKALIIGPTILAAAAALFISSSMTPMYRSEARVLVESNDNVYTRPEGASTGELREADELAVQSQVQLLLSRDLAREVVTELNLAENDEFEVSGNSLAKRALVLLGLSRDPLSQSIDERVLDAFFERLSVYAVPTSRVIVVEFSSSDPELAAEVANAVAERYLELQQSAKQATTRKASTWLASEIKDLSTRVAEAEAKVEEFRSKSNLFLGTNNATITTQQLGELNTELARARAQQSDAQAKAELLKAAVDSGRPVESLDVANSELLRELAQQRVALGSVIARESRTYLPAHPRMKELQAQIGSLESQIREEARKIARAYENEANVAAARVASVQQSIDIQKKVAGDAGGQEVQLRALEREAKAQRDLLEQFLARYRDAAARERVEAIPPDARIISRATPAGTPYAPKPLAITVLTALGTFILLVVGITASEFMVVPAGPAPRAPTPPAPPPPSSRPEDKPARPLPPTKDATPEPVARTESPQPVARVVPPALADAAKTIVTVDGAPPVFGKLGASGPAATQTEQMEIEAADMRMLGDLASHLATMPKGDGALNILVASAMTGVDPGSVALSLARSLSGAGRKTIVADAGSASRDFAATLPNPGEGGLGELIAGDTSFGQAIQRDRASAAHLIGPGKSELLNAEAYARIAVVFDALGLTYDFVIVLSPAADKPEDMIALAKRMGAAILVANVQDLVTTAAHRALEAAGVGDVVLLLTGAAQARAAS